MNRHVDRKTAKKNLLLFAALSVVALLIAAVTAYSLWKDSKDRIGEPGAIKPVQTLKSAAEAREAYDVIVVGTDPEGVAAAVSAGRNGLKTLLVDGFDREVLGGLMTLGWLNSLDHNYDRTKSSLLSGKHDIFNKGIFEEWYTQVEGDSFDVVTATNAFHSLVDAEPNVEVLLGMTSIEPLLESGAGDTVTVVGVTVTTADGTERQLAAKTVIDATQDADIAAAAGAPYTFGRADLGDEQARMAVTLVFRLKNVTPDVWKQVKQRLDGDNNPDTGANERSAWGYNEMQDYPAQNKERVKMRGLNIGRQNDETMLINALQIFGIDGTDPESRKEAFEIGQAELPHVVAYMKELYPEFAGLELDATAPELYIRESRHLIGEYRLSMIDVLENRDQWDRVAFGSYPVDIQRITPNDNGAVMSRPLKYAVPFRSLVPLKVEQLLVVGRSASFDTLPHGSARVIPVGMATAQAAGVASKLAIDNGLTFRELSRSETLIAELQQLLNSQGMELAPYELDPEPFMAHPAYPGLKTVASMGLVVGGYNNNFDLDGLSNPQRVLNMMLGVKRVHKLPGDPVGVTSGLADATKPPLALQQAAWTMARAAGLDVEAAAAVEALRDNGLLRQQTVDGIANPAELKNGDVYMMAHDLVEAIADRQ